jgi:trehalose synthase
VPAMQDVAIRPLPIDWLGAVIGLDRLTGVRRSLMRLRRLLGDRTVWTVNSTASGGGVAEMLPRVLGYQRAAGIRAPWMVIGGDEPFFALTKRLHHCLHGSPGDGGPLGPAEHRHYRDVLAANTQTLLGRVRPGDIAILHYPQVAALAGPLRAAGLTTIWRCHVGADVRNQYTEAAWSFLRPYLEPVDAFVFSRPVGPPVPAGSPLIVQVSRWDPLKDPIGVMEAFVRLDLDRHDCHLALVGPDVSGVSDDPEGQAVLAACVSAWEALPFRERARIHLVSLPMDDPTENALMVNAIQRHAAVVVQKSLAEGFGLTVTEAMWKARPVVASAVGGIRDQIDDGVHGHLLDDPADRDGLAAVLSRLLDSPHAETDGLGRRAKDRVRAEFLDDRQLLDWAALFDIVIPGHQAA